MKRAAGDPRRLHVGLNLVYLQADSGGPGTYATELIRALHAAEPGTRITAWIGRGAPGDIERDDLGGPVEWVRLPVKSAGSPVHVPVELLCLGLSAHRRGCDVIHGLAYATPVIAPGVATVVTIHDLIWLHYPESVTRLARGMFRLFTLTCGRTADRVIAVSETARDDLVSSLGVPPHKIDVTPLGVGSSAGVAPVAADALRTRYRLSAGAPVLLCVGQIAAHKNLVTLVDALALLARRDTVVIIPGRHTPYRDELVARAAQRGVAERLVLPGFVDRDELEGLYALATAFVLPSIIEGFGLPIAEAMARGVPVACSDTSALPEVAGGAALLFDPRNPVAIAAALDHLIGDSALRDQLAQRGRARAAQLTWERTAETTLRAYRAAIASRGQRGRA